MTSARALSLQGLNFTKDAPEISQGVKELVARYQRGIDALLAEAKSESKQESFKRFLRLADADGHASFASVELTLPALVSGNAEVRSASSEAKKRIKNMFAELYARPDVYAALLQGAEGAETEEEKRLVTVTLEKFRQAGAAVADVATRAKVSALDARCAELAFRIEQNINEDCTEVPLKEDDLEGCSADFIGSLPIKDGETATRLCSVKAPTLMPVLTRCQNEDTRRRMLEASQRKCIDTNSESLDQLLTCRHEAANLLGFTCHAERMLAQKMAGNVPRAGNFCEEMLRRLQPLRDADLLKLEKRKSKHMANKRKHQEEEEKHSVNLWDVQFFSDALKCEELLLDDEKIKEFFPLEGTIERILSVYETMLGLSFKRCLTAPVWHEEVVVFEVFNQRNGELAGHLYLDQHPRPGKFGHQMVVPLTPCFTDGVTGEKSLPACVNISNLARPQGNKPALLRFEEMRTLFHELGHCMHALCCHTRFSSLSWAWPMVPWPGGVEQDFLELPSMALENFATEPALLGRVARHYSGDLSVQLGQDILDKLKMLDRWMIGVTKTKYYAMALADLALHCQAPPYKFGTEEGLSVQQLYARILEKHTTLTEFTSTHPCASWYHLVIGYDAGYYGYGWSDVFAADVFETMRTSAAGLISPETGGKLREDILAPCASRPANDMLLAFLGREPTVEAWCRRIGIEK